MRTIGQLLIGLGILCVSLLQVVSADTIGELARIGGVRSNRVIGYGLVVGLPGTGDQTTEIPYTTQTITNMLRHMGVILPPGQFMQPNNVAAVMVTGNIPQDAQPGQKFTVTVSAMGNATSLQGGILLMTQLHGANGRVYAQAQGPLLVSGISAQGVTASTRINNPDVGQIENGGVVEVPPVPMSSGNSGVTLLLRKPNYITAARMVEAINAVFPAAATAMGPGVVQVRAPFGSNSRVGFLAALEQIPVHAPKPVPTVVINAQDGTVVMSANVRVSPCAVATGSLSVSVENTPEVSQPNLFGRGVTVVVSKSKAKIKTHKAHLVLMSHTASLEDIVRTLNTIGATPQQLISILRAMKVDGALHARIKVI
ncbi:flagellar basal body P-ring protein FlgI [Acidithiobacillus caldus]|uniref:Flagellar P-ring protein n=1 Tax=Acidithiobacillus caldus (strain ATCC 51756 / DSM 8584 / KU) TaxID=637389 RepID=A0A060A0M0_ACICK|nr:flagellar basal body P-ring protein FlgI [Acidithiobacillus caldus]AIA55776.1 Flagellar P-ring protein FlgI [Acidithiobacillus caldus ATCC 51756]MBU2729963.1 flagellar basal body P-ring protein FlgI [Acidithiobacillus caldus]MBU2734197.1 flagellar basal body P-ring protein FlgI [Acidithiobacillus caldus ATCC 51756]MBU2745144.1 flagellar basal body P-ring protein FlgI [Acidithiobacillus caldus]MBU2779932.1 flagellar basal body P-ring protein FlgI [Acidithiobacillus caldus]